MTALLRHRPGVFGGDMHLFRCNWNYFGRLGELLGHTDPVERHWRKSVKGRILVTPVEGAHHTLMFAQSAHGIAQKMLPLLAKADRRLTSRRSPPSRERPPR